MFGLTRFENEEYTFYLHIVFGVCLGSHALRTKNIHFIWRVFGLERFKDEEYTLYLACSRLFAESEHCIWRVVGLALFKNEEYTLHLALLGWHT